eukprot:1178584-Prorocentrum_minimum.AAC.1
MDGGGYIPHLAPPLAHLVARLLLQRLACALQAPRDTVGSSRVSCTAWGDAGSGLRFWTQVLDADSGLRFWTQVLDAGSGLRFWAQVLDAGSGLRFWTQ